jgi:uncharacterized membrane protein (UPF0182 family)
LSRSIKILLLILVLFIAACVLLNDFYVNILWFKEVGYLSVFLKELTTKLKFGIPLFLILFILFSVYFRFLNLSGGKTQEALKEKGKFVRKKLPYLLGLIAAAITAGGVIQTLWYKWLEFSNSVDFGTVDPVFGKDLSFFIFKLPFLHGALKAAFILIGALFIATILYSSMIIGTKNKADKAYNKEHDGDTLNFKNRLQRFWMSFRVQISIFFAAAFVLGAAYAKLAAYDLVYSTRGIVYGAGYTDVHVYIPLYTVLMIFCLIAALGMLLFGLTKKIKPFLITIALFVIIAVGGNVYGLIIQNYVVSPNEFTKEETYIADNIEYTRMAYGLNNIQVKQFSVSQDITAQDIIDNETTIKNIPINDYSPTLDAYNSLQSIRSYYQFNDTDVDRYYVNGQYTQVFISAREINTDNLTSEAQTWINKYMKYTHGFGVAISAVNQTTTTGQPALLAQDIPTVSDYPELALFQGRIYFGETTDNYAVVNTKTKEFDYPSGDDNVQNVYDGDAGIQMTFLNRISFSLYEKTLKFLLSTDITSETKVLINRNIMDRVTSIAPFLTYDSDPYIVLADGQLYWIIDAMTTTDRYPYSQPYSEDSDINYVRNSVKVVVNAYNGDVSFYIIDETDPIAAVCAKIYPDLFKSIDEMPESIQSHLRYSEALFNIQASMYLDYHMTNAATFYNKEDSWSVSTQFYGISNEAVNVNSAYMIMKLPDRDEEFLLMASFTPVNKDNMVAWMAGICDGDEYGQLVVYQFDKNTQVYGTMQMEQRIDQDTTIAPQLALLSQQGSNVLRGNMLTIPINDSLLYVETIYIQSSGGDNSLPEAKKVIVCYNDTIVMADTLSESLNQIFGVTVSDEISSDTVTQSATSSDRDALITRASELYTLAEQAQKDGDWVAYGAYMQELGGILKQLGE